MRYTEILEDYTAAHSLCDLMRERREITHDEMVKFRRHIAAQVRPLIELPEEKPDGV